MYFFGATFIKGKGLGGEAALCILAHEMRALACGLAVLGLTAALRPLSLRGPFRRLQVPSQQLMSRGPACSSCRLWSSSSGGSGGSSLIDDDADPSGSWAFLKSAGRRCADLLHKLVTQPSFRQELLDMCTVRWQSVFRNIRAGEAGHRGEEWLVAQLFLMAFITLGINPVFVFFIRLLGLGVGAFGAYMMVRAAWILKENLSPFVVPVSGNYLVTTDLYEVVRHPQYGGLILCCVGFSLVTNSCDRLIFTLVLAALLGAKADREDQALAARHPMLHAVYLGRTERKFVPYVL